MRLELSESAAGQMKLPWERGFRSQLARPAVLTQDFRRMLTSEGGPAHWPAGATIRCILKRS